MKTSFLFTDKTLPKCRISSKNEINLYDFFSNIMLLLFAQFPLIKAAFIVQKIDDHVKYMLDIFVKNIQNKCYTLSSVPYGKYQCEQVFTDDHFSFNLNYKWLLNVNNYRDTYITIQQVNDIINLLSVYSIYIHDERLEVSCLNYRVKEICNNGDFVQVIDMYVNSDYSEVILRGNIQQEYKDIVSVSRIISNYKFLQVKQSICTNSINDLNNLMLLERINQRYRIFVALTVIILIYFVIY